MTKVNLLGVIFVFFGSCYILYSYFKKKKSIKTNSWELSYNIEIYSSIIGLIILGIFMILS